MDTPRIPDKVTLTDVQSFVEGNIVASRKEEIRCGDGRTYPEQSRGAVRAFGEDYGMMLAIRGALWNKGVQGVDNGRLIDSYLAAVKPDRGEKPRLFMHTDTHAERGGGFGCGHARLSQSDIGGYVIPGSEAASLYEAILARPEVDMQVIEGEHAEQGALLVESEIGQDGNRFSVNSMDAERKSSYFVVDVNGIMDHLQRIMPHFSGDLGAELTPEEVMVAYETQQGKSADELARKKGIPFFRVRIDSQGTAVVEPLE